MTATQPTTRTQPTVRTCPFDLPEEYRTLREQDPIIKGPSPTACRAG